MGAKRRDPLFNKRKIIIRRRAGPNQTLTFTSRPVAWALACVFEASVGATVERSDEFSALPFCGVFSLGAGSLINSLNSRFLATATRANNDVTLAMPPDWFPFMSIVLMYQHFYSKKQNEIYLTGKIPLNGNSVQLFCSCYVARPDLDVLTRAVSIRPKSVDRNPLIGGVCPDRWTAIQATGNFDVDID